MDVREDKFNRFDEPRRTPNESFVSSNMSKDSESSLLLRISRITFGMIFPPLVIAIFSTYVYFETQNKFLIIPVLVSIPGLISIITMCLLSKSSHTSGTRASNFLIYSLYIVHFCSASYFFLGLLLVFLFKNNETLPHFAYLALLFIEGSCVKFIFGYALLFISIKKLIIEYQNIRNYLQVMVLALLICGIGICLTCESYKSSWDNIDISYQLPPVILNLGIVAGFGLIFTALLLFFASYKEKLSILLLGQILSVVLMIFLFLVSGMVRYCVDVYSDFIRKNCAYVMKIMNASEFECEKYTNTSCGKEFIAEVWENGMEGGERCLNSECCEEIRVKIFVSLEVLMVWVLLAAILLMFSWLAGQGLVKKVEKFGKSSEKSFDFKVAGIMIIVVLISLAGWFTSLSSPQLIRPNEPIFSIKGAELLDQKFVSGNLCENFHTPVNFNETFDVIRLESEYGSIYPNEFKAHGKHLSPDIKTSVFCADYLMPSYELLILYIEINETETILTTENFTISFMISGDQTISTPLKSPSTLTPSYHLSPLTEISSTIDFFSFTAPLTTKAYTVSVLVNNYTIYYILGSLYPTITQISIPPAINSTLSVALFTDSLAPTKLLIASGFNNIYSFADSSIDSSEFNLTSGLYTVFTSSIHYSRAVRNIVVDDERTQVDLVNFPLELNKGFTVVLTSRNSSLVVRFNSSQNKTCKVSSKFPRCGGSRLLWSEGGEVFISAKIAPAHYLVYLEGEDFQRDHIAFYSKGNEWPEFAIEGKKGAGVWTLFCINGRTGVNSLKVVDTKGLDSQACTRFYGNETWDSENPKN